MLFVLGLEAVTVRVLHRSMRDRERDHADHIVAVDLTGLHVVRVDDVCLRDGGLEPV